jgi:CDP-diacylglycerol---glycerol-3-phosphate 3-phosphatidyltransferase
VTPTAAQALLPLLALVVFLLATLVVYAARWKLLGPSPTPEITARERTMLAKFFQEWWVWLYGPAVRFCLRFHISPDAITVASTLFAGGAALLLGAGWLSVGGWAYLFGASFDLVDGRVARATGQVSKAGAFLDSTLDRVQELFVFSALAYQFHGSPWLLAPIWAAGASFVVSYARARGESLGVGSEARVGGMQRPERVFITGLSCALSPLADAWRPGSSRAVIGAALTFLAVSASITAIRRTWSIYRSLKGLQPTPKRERRLAAVFRFEPKRSDASR